MSEHEGVRPGRLFLGSCLALIATSVAFAVIGDIMGKLKTEFVLTNEQVGWVGGAALWGFTVSIVVLGPLCDALGMRNLLRLAFLGHAIGVVVMIFANGFWMLLGGALILAMGNGTVEAACNPLVATIYPENKTTKLNQFHVWFPGGIVLGGLACFFLGELGFGSWQLRLALVLLPTLIYGLLFRGQAFPATERVQSGLSFAQMVGHTLFRPLFLLLFLGMAVTASLELGPNRWIPAILQAGGMHGILVLVWINCLMAILRFFAGPIVHRLSPTGLLFVSAILAGVGLYSLSFAQSMTAALAAATVFALGVCYFWPTMLGVVSERVPKGGALALALMGGMGMAASGLLASPQLGKIADLYLPEKLDGASTRACLQQIVDTYPALKTDAKKLQHDDIQAVIDAAQGVLTEAGTSLHLPHPDTANAFRSAIGLGDGDPDVARGSKILDDAGPETDLAKAAAAAGLRDEFVAAARTLKEAKAILGPADNYGGRMSFRWLAPFAIILVVIFGLLYWSDRKKGGYKTEDIGKQDPVK